VLVKGMSGTDTISAVYGPYTKAHADWIKTELVSGSYELWTVMELASFTETPPECTSATDAGPAAPARREMSCTSASTERRDEVDFEAKPVRAFGFTSG
jgi:hypothetical protein